MTKYNFYGLTITKLERKKGITENKTKYYLGALKKDNAVGKSKDIYNSILQDKKQKYDNMIYISSIYHNAVGKEFMEYQGKYYNLLENGNIELRA